MFVSHRTEFPNPEDQKSGNVNGHEEILCITAIPTYLVYDGFSEDMDSVIVYELLMDCQHTSDMHTRALEFLHWCMLRGWRLSDVKPFFSHKIVLGMLPHQVRLWGRKKCTVLFPVITGPPGPSMSLDIPQAQPPLLTHFSQPQGLLQRTSYYLDASDIQ